MIIGLECYVVSSILGHNQVHSKSRVTKGRVGVGDMGDVSNETDFVVSKAYVIWRLFLKEKE